MFRFASCLCAGRWWLFLILLTGLSACHAPQAASSRGPAPYGTRNGAYSLLYDLLSQEKNIDKLLLLKNEKEDLGELIVEIAQVSQDTAEELKDFAHTDPSLSLEVAALPPAEVKTRESIASARAKKLVLSKGQNFELQLLLTQHEALSYGTHLARVARDHDKNMQRRLRVEQLVNRLQALNDRVFQLLLNRMRTR